MTNPAERTDYLNDKPITYVPTESRFRVEVGRYSKGAYKPRYSFTNLSQAVFFFNCINIGYGYKKRLRLMYDNGKSTTLLRHTS